MWNDIKIGKGETGITTIRTFSIEGDHKISDNSVCYRINGLLIDVGMTIMKYTKEGQKLTELIEKKKSLETIMNFLNTVMLKHLKPEVLKKKIDQAIKEAFENGKQKRSRELRELLGLEDFY